MELDPFESTGDSAGPVVGLIEALAHQSIKVRCPFEQASTWPDAKLSKRVPTQRYRTARQLRPDELDELVAAYQAGRTVYELAEQFGIERRTVGRHLRARGVDTTPPGLHPDDVPQAAELYRGGWSLARIAEKFGTTANTVRSRLIEVGVRMREPWERAR